MVGRPVFHSLTIDHLGGGGRGIVCQAAGTRLTRHGARESLPADLARDRLVLDRFRRHARDASALNHPHVCPIHDTDEVEAMTVLPREVGADHDRRAEPRAEIAGRPTHPRRQPTRGLLVR